MSKFTKNQFFLIVLPALLLVSTYFIFILFVQWFGNKIGYLCGFIFYWSFWCLLIPFALLRKSGLKELFKPMYEEKSKFKLINIILLILPPLFAIFFGPFFSRIANVDFKILVLSFVLAAVNAFCEEVLWRGLYVKIFDRNIILGYIIPAIGFAIWHIAPNAVNASKQGVVPFLAGALFIGLCWGFVAYRTKSIRWTFISHIILDFSGIGALFYFS